MAEAHQAVGFEFTVIPEGADAQLSHQALTEIYLSAVNSWKKCIIRIKNSVIRGVYPASPFSWLFVVIAILATMYTRSDPSMGLIAKIQENLPQNIQCMSIIGMFFLTIFKFYATVVKTLFSVSGICLCQALVRIFSGRKPRLYSYQASLPNLPVPAVKDTVKRYLESVRPLMDDAQYEHVTKLAAEFESSLGNRLQWYLKLKALWVTNYVSDWWEEYVYLRGRNPIMVNSNYYVMDFLYVTPTPIQAARAGNTIYAMLLYRCKLNKEEIKPVGSALVPCCSYQFERMFNTCRIPGTLTDTIQHWKDSDFIVVYHKGRYFQLYVYQDGRLLCPREIEFQIQRILDDPSPASKGEARLGALTAGDRIPWAKARAKHFNSGINKKSLDCIEKAAFFVTLDDEEQSIVGDNLGESLDCYIKSLFTPVTVFLSLITVCGTGGLTSLSQSGIMRRTNQGHCKGEVDASLAEPQKLNWEISSECEEQISQSLEVAQALANDVDMHVVVFRDFGKAKVKKCRVNPDAFIQIALQLAYYRDQKRFSLTYESSMTRLFREGRTETVRSCTNESCAFIRALEGGETTDVCRRLFRTASEKHQRLCRMASTGAGIDRHLFCLYVVSKCLGVESPFLKELESEAWRLSSSHIPYQMIDLFDTVNHPEYLCYGGGFGPVTDDGYGVCYLMLGGDVLTLHISCKNSCPDTDARKFGARIRAALHDLMQLLSPNPKEPSKTEANRAEVKKDR
uniref:Carnitine O-palmitoyltransferase n=1 Tax=Takifugu rubripes TaxID=31033 RepID=A0A674MKP7_TAKRU